MSEEKAIFEWQRLLDSKQTILKYRNALAGDGGGTVSVSGEPGYIWCRYSSDQSKVSKVFNIIAPGVPEDFPIVVGRRFPTDEFEQVLAVNWTLYQDTVTEDTVNNFATGNHGESHNAAGGSDPAPIDLRNILEMRARAQDTPDLTVRVERGQYVYGYNDVKQFPSGNIDLTASVPAVAGHMYSLIYVDGATNALANDDSVVVPLAAAPVIPDITQNTIPICIVDLENGQTTITEDDIYDYRFMWDLVSWQAPWMVGTNADRLALTVGDLADLTHFAETDTDQIWQVWEGAWRIVYPPAALAASDGSPATPWTVGATGALTGTENLTLSGTPTPNLQFIDGIRTCHFYYADASNALYLKLSTNNDAFIIRDATNTDAFSVRDDAYTRWLVNTAQTNTTFLMSVRRHETSGTAAAGLGLRDQWSFENSAASTEAAAHRYVEWENATNGSEDAQIRFFLMKGGAASAEFVKFAATETVFNEGGLDVDFRVEGLNNTDLLSIDGGNDQVGINGILSSTPDEITATDAGVAASVDTVNTEVTTNGDADLDNVTLANGVSGQIKHIYCVVLGNAGDTWKITPANMIGGSQITFSAAGQGCTLVYADNEGWCVVANNGGTIT